MPTHGFVHRFFILSGKRRRRINKKGTQYSRLACVVLYQCVLLFFLAILFEIEKSVDSPTVACHYRDVLCSVHQIKATIYKGWQQQLLWCDVSRRPPRSLIRNASATLGCVEGGVGIVLLYNKSAEEEEEERPLGNFRVTEGKLQWCQTGRYLRLFSSSCCIRFKTWRIEREKTCAHFYFFQLTWGRGGSVSFENRDSEMMSSIDFPIGRVSCGGGHDRRDTNRQKEIVHV
jgi:hypothetical protein